jgi:DNA (cytosine-5)-methyltransferase 1
MNSPSLTLERPNEPTEPLLGASGLGLSDFGDVPSIGSDVGTFVSLYAGAGGMDIGFSLAGFRPTWVNELDHYAAATHESATRQLQAERPHLRGVLPRVHTGSLLDIPEGDLPTAGSADLVIGGPPCQGFSVAGKMDPDDQRSIHVFHFMEMVGRVRPKAFVMENVKALFENQRFSLIRERLADRAEELGYSAEMFLCNASHFGVPQARERMLFIGILDGSPSRPTPSSKDNPPTVREALAQLPAFGMPGNDGICPAKVTPAKSPVMRRSPYAGMLFNGAGRPMDPDAPAPTVPASMGGNRTPIVDQEQLDTGTDPWVLKYHAHLRNGGKPRKSIPKRMRRLTVQEASAIQTFPLGMTWVGPQTVQFRQIGNAVPPRLALAAAENLKGDLGIF